MIHKTHKRKPWIWFTHLTGSPLIGQFNTTLTSSYLSFSDSPTKKKKKKTANLNIKLGITRTIHDPTASQTINLIGRHENGINENGNLQPYNH